MARRGRASDTRYGNRVDRVAAHGFHVECIALAGIHSRPKQGLLKLWRRPAAPRSSPRYRRGFGGGAGLRWSRRGKISYVPRTSPPDETGGGGFLQR